MNLFTHRNKPGLSKRKQKFIFSELLDDNKKPVSLQKRLLKHAYLFKINQEVSFFLRGALFLAGFVAGFV